MAMQMLYMQWRAVRVGLVPFVIAAFGLPLFVVQWMGGADGRGLEFAQIALANMEATLLFFPLLATAIGFTLALSAWNWDHKGNHVYALSLPVARWRYALLKFGAGVVLALAPMAALLIGSVVATSTIQLPAGLQAYPLEITLRFFLAILVQYALWFSLASGTIRTASIVLGTLVGAPILMTLGLQLLGHHTFPWMSQVSVGEALIAFLIDFGPFRLLTGGWMLIDV